ncbi:SDR family NAD(P)-dependent oxidoreductase [Catellatospora sp. KI3]|uniref:SDR family NAD(P)-dependent oxidoreductase n=1 Tax=Catellatospora sp. KI3 TaxID=3041620 RepID=UPI002482F0B8|nr:SDR family NAD(P)-dependent oxidoreductase [Catellatospora sp. KI3]MDI1465900.1 SDR family NAD(P)-dependent oxidoreductase [Catellatospora sp. KI3]
MTAPTTRNVLITGGSSGIGREAVRGFARAGDTVWFTYLTGARRAKELVDELAAEGLAVTAYEFQQGEWDSHQNLLATLPGPVDVLINNAAVGSKTVEDYEPGAAHERSAAMLRINSVGPLWLSQQIVPDMLDRGYGKIVNVASVGGGVATFAEFDPADGMSKAALVQLSRQLAVELAHTPVDVFAVCPGAVETNMLGASVLGRLDAPARQAFEARLPKQRLIQPDEIARLIQWLCTADAATLHGAVLDASFGLGLAPGLFQPGAA